MKKVLLLAVAAAVFGGLLLMPTATAGKGGTDRPFSATVSGSVHWEFPGVSPSNCEVVTTLSEATGEATHLGRVTWSDSHCPAMPDYIWDGRATLVAANGDKLYYVYDYGETYPLPAFFAGGTGRFANATGTASITYEVIGQLLPGCTDPENFDCLDFSVPWPGTWQITGTINY